MRQAHYLRPNEANRYPRRLFCLDSEAAITGENGTQRHGFRLAVATFDRIDPATRAAIGHDHDCFESSADLWEWIDARTSTNGRSVLFAHNLGYDLRLTGALLELPRLGWQLKALALNRRSTWLRWVRGKRSLSMVDSTSFVPHSLERIGTELGYLKAPLPEQHDDDEAWKQRCYIDTLILREAVLRILGWLETNDMGSFRLTGPAQSQAAFRHRFMRPKSLVIHDNADAVALERRSAWTGRCEVWKHGRAVEPLYEWDFALAYAEIARSTELPVCLRSRFRKLSLRDAYAMMPRYRLLLDVTLSAEHPTAPTERNGRILWPRGRFRTVLWDNELVTADQAGTKIQIHGGYSYSKAPLLKDWAEWIVAQLQTSNGEPDPLIRLMLKTWSRSLIGRFGLKHPTWKAAGHSEANGLLFLPGFDLDSRTNFAYLNVAGDLLEQNGDEEAPDAAPMVMAYIMAEARCRLWRAMIAAGLENVYYVDTDALFVNRRGSYRLSVCAAEPEFRNLRCKKTHHEATLYAPRCIELDGERRIAGLPKSAEWVGEQTYAAEYWEGASESFRRQRPDSVTVQRRTTTLAPEDRRRFHNADGETLPYALWTPIHVGT